MGHTIQTTRLDGPIPEFDKYGNSTGHNFYRCTNCGAEAMRTEYLNDCCEAAPGATGQ